MFAQLRTSVEATAAASEMSMRTHHQCPFLWAPTGGGPWGRKRPLFRRHRHLFAPWMQLQRAKSKSVHLVAKCEKSVPSSDTPTSSCWPPFFFCPLVSVFTPPSSIIELRLRGDEDEEPNELPESDPLIPPLSPIVAAPTRSRFGGQSVVKPESAPLFVTPCPSEGSLNRSYFDTADDNKRFRRPITLLEGGGRRSLNCTPVLSVE